jgi:hypothetical protein
MAPPPPRRSLGALFLVLALAFAGIAAGAADGVGSEPALIVLVLAAAVISLWFLSLSLRNLRKRRS